MRTSKAVKEGTMLGINLLVIGAFGLFALLGIERARMGGYHA